MHFFNPTLTLLLGVGLSATSALPSNLNTARLLERAEEQSTNLRIEGLTETFYEAPIISGPRDISTKSGGTHPCTGTNNNANPLTANTPTDALDAASKLAYFTYDGTFDPEFDDFFITRISSDTQASNEFWGLLVNYQFAPVGGCQYETKEGDDILWAYNAFNLEYFLKLQSTSTIVELGKPFIVTVTDGLTGQPLEGATVDGVLTDANGQARLTISKLGVSQFKATMQNSLRSNAITVVVV